MQLHEIQDLERRVRSYWYDDGIAELSGGGMLVLLGLYFAVQGYFGERSTIAVILSVSMVLLFLAGTYAVRRLVAAFKSRVTYPRTGFVEYRDNSQDAKRRRFGAAAVAIVLAAVLVARYRSIDTLDLVVLISGLMMGLILIVLRGRASGLERFYLLGALAILLGVVLSLAGMAQAYALGLLYGLLGVAILLSGLLALRRYIAENPAQPETPRDH